jgi:hypothetical protein
LPGKQQHGYIFRFGRRALRKESDDMNESISLEGFDRLNESSFSAWVK